jgi:hypothetical protein
MDVSQTEEYWGNVNPIEPRSAPLQLWFIETALKAIWELLSGRAVGAGNDRRRGHLIKR